MHDGTDRNILCLNGAIASCQLFLIFVTFLQLEHAEETTERRRTMECEKANTELLQAKYKVNNRIIE